MSVKKLALENALMDDNARTTMIFAGDTVTTRTVSKCNVRCKILKLDKDTYVYIPTGEILEYKHESTSRTNFKNNLVNTFNQIRNLINANITKDNYKNVLFVTLTFAENMQDSYRAYNEFKKFKGRFDTYCKNKRFDIPKYISVIEPQARGAFHFHVLFIFSDIAPFIPNCELEEIWKNGFTDIQRLKGDIQNVGNYLCSYMTDIMLDEEGNEIVINSKHKKKSSVKKGARLHFYPTGLHIVRHSKDIVYPTVVKTTYGKIDKHMSELGNVELCYQAAYEFKDENTNFENVVLKSFYLKTECQKSLYDLSKTYLLERLTDIESMDGEETEYWIYYNTYKKYTYGNEIQQSNELAILIWECEV